MAEGEAIGGAAEAAKGGAANIGGGLKSKLGPFPVYVWLLIAGGIGAIYFFVIAPGQQGNNAPGSGMLPGDLLGGGGGGGSTSATTTSTGTYASNQAWVQGAAASVATSLGLPLSEVTNYLNEYLNGQMPAGSYGAQSTFESVVNSAIQSAGTPPQAITSGQSNPFTTNTSWLSAILAALPTGTSQSTQNDIINLVNGTVTSISQSSSDALQAAINIVGQGPTPLSYTTIAPLSQAAINTWSNAFHSSATQDYNSWLANAPAAITSVVSPTTLQAIYNYHATSAGAAAVAAAGGAYNWWANYLSNPTTIPIVAAATTGGGSASLTPASVTTK